MNIVPILLDQSIHFISRGGIFVGFLSVFLECFIPALPLSVFVAFNVNVYGFFLGVFISWIATCLGSYFCYLCFSCFSNRISHSYWIEKRLKGKKAIDFFQTIQFTELVLLLTLPFTPSSFINVMAGITKIPKEKYMMALLIGKCFSIIFWGYIGKSLIQSVTDFASVSYIIVTLLFAYIISKMVSNRMSME